MKSVEILKVLPLRLQGAEGLHAELEAQAAALKALRRDIDAADAHREAEQQATFARYVLIVTTCTWGDRVLSVPACEATETPVLIYYA